MSVVNLRRRFEAVDWTQTSGCEVAVTAGNSDGLKSLLEQGEKITISLFFNGNPEDT